MVYMEKYEKLKNKFAEFNPRKTPKKHTKCQVKARRVKRYWKSPRK